MNTRALANFSENIKNPRMRKSVLISYLIGLPSGLIFSFLALYFSIKDLDEGLPIIGLISIYGIPLIGLLFGFFLALGYAAVKAYNNLKQGKSILYTSFLYSLKVNIIIWTVFVVVALLTQIFVIFMNFDENGSYLFILFSIFAPAIIIFPVSVFFTTFTIGYLICYLINRQVIDL